MIRYLGESMTAKIFINVPVTVFIFQLRDTVHVWDWAILNGGPSGTGKAMVCTPKRRGSTAYRLVRTPLALHFGPKQLTTQRQPAPAQTTCPDIQIQNSEAPI